MGVHRHIGLAMPTAAPDVLPETPLEFARRADVLGLHSVWAIDRLAFRNADPLLTLAAVAAVTTRVRLGTSILLGGLRPPLLFAKMIATLDQLSGGRLIVGLGVGSRADDFAAAGVPFHRRGPRLSELIQVAQQAWAGAPIRHVGEFYEYQLGPLGPRPIQQPHPPLWFGGNADGALHRAGRLGDGYIGGSSRGHTGFRSNWEKVQLYAREARRDPSLLTPAALVFACVDDDRTRAIEVATRYVQQYYGADRLGGPVGPHPFVGPASECIDAAEQYFEAGVEVLIIGSMTADLRYLDRLCEHVLPHILT